MKKLAAYDEDSTLSVDLLLSLPTCSGRIGATGMCLGGHLAYRCALDERVKAAVCYFATDVHSRTLGEGKNDDSLARAGDIKGELLMVSLTLSHPSLFLLMRSVSSAGVEL
jgi:dienelactone hydrolase